ncbi:hypothetical protein Gpo141_00014010 [Globisporangium polare]
MYDAVWSPKYQFTMRPIVLQAIDVVTAQLRDLQDEVAQLKRKTETVTGPLVLGLESTEATSSGDVLLWTPKSDFAAVAATDAFVVEPSGSIRFLRAGTYLITVTVEYQNADNIWKQYTIERDGVALQTYRGWGGGSGCSSLVVSMALDQVVSVETTSAHTTQSGSSMFIVLLK